MKKFILLSLSLMFAASSLLAQEAPLIDREIFFGNPEIAGGQLSPDGKYVSFMKEHDGIMNVWVKAFDEDFSEARLLTASSSPILGYFWTYDAKYILYVNDNGGDENMNIFAVDPGMATADEVPESRNLTPLKEVTAQILQVSRDNPDKLIVGLNDRDKAWHDLYELTISTGELVLLRENKDRYTGWTFDWDENMRLANRVDENGHSEILRIDDEGQFELIYKTNLKESAYVAGWTPDNSKCYLVSNKGDVNLSTLFLMDPNDGSLVEIESDPDGKVDFGGMFIDDNTREILFTSYTNNKRKRIFRNEEWKAMHAYLESQFPGREVGYVSFTKDYSKMLIAASGDKYASDMYFFNRNTKELIHQYTPKPKLKEVEKYLSAMTPVSFKSSDGMEIPAYLSLPYGKMNKNLPTVIMVHGGPKGPRDNWGYNGSIQFLTNRGYVVLQPNFRASGGFGKEFLNAGDKEWGKKMQDDITWGAKYLVNQGIADEDKIAIMGGSYGGYATLAGLAFTPDVYACGVDIVGPSNLFTLLESIPPYWEAGRKWLHEMVGDPETEEGQKLLKEASPLFSADKISKPLMIVQGANDPRVKKAESDQIVIALRDQGHPVEYLLAMDEGHGFRKPLNRMAMYAQVEKFFANYLGGRYQKEMPDDVAETVEKLTVDVNTVVYKKMDEMETLMELPALDFAWTEGSADYDVVMEMNGQKIPMTMTRTVRKDGDQWIVSEESKSAMGNASDALTYGANLQGSKRMINQAGQEINLNYSGKALKAAMMGQEMNIEAKGALIADGPGYDFLIGAMNLKEGEKVSYYVADMMTMKPKQVILTSEGQDVLNGEAHNVYVITNVENEGDVTKMWIKDGVASKTEVAIPMMNGKLTTTKK